MTVSDAALDRVRRARGVVEHVLERGDPVYGMNTGVGSLSRYRVPFEHLEQFSATLVSRHTTHQGAEVSPEVVRAMMVTRVNGMAKGGVGVRTELLAAFVDALNAGVHPVVRLGGSVVFGQGVVTRVAWGPAGGTGSAHRGPPRGKLDMEGSDALPARGRIILRGGRRFRISGGLRHTDESPDNSSGRGAARPGRHGGLRPRFTGFGRRKKRKPSRRSRPRASDLRELKEREEARLVQPGLFVVAFKRGYRTRRCSTRRVAIAVRSLTAYIFAGTCAHENFPIHTAAGIKAAGMIIPRASPRTSPKIVVDHYGASKAGRPDINWVSLSLYYQPGHLIVPAAYRPRVHVVGSIRRRSSH